MSGRRRFAAAGVLVGLLGLFAATFGAGLAQAQDPPSPPTMIRAIDGRDAEDVRLELIHAGDLQDVQVLSEGAELETGDPIAYLEADDVAPIGLVVVVDTSEAMDDSGALAATRDGLEALIEQKPDNQRVGIISAGDSPTVLSVPTDNTERLLAAVDGLAPSDSGDAALWGAVEQAARALQDRSFLQPNLLVIATGEDDVSAGRRGSAIGEAVASGATVFALGSESAGFDAASLDELVERTGGSIASVETPAELGEAVEEVEGWLTGDQWVIPFVANQDEGVVPVTVVVGDTQVEGAYVAGRFAQGAEEVKVFERSGGGFSVPFLTGSLGLWLGIGLALVAVAGLVYAIVLLVTRDEGELSNVLQPYSEPFGGEGEDEEESGYATTALLQRAVEVTEQVAESQGYLSRTEAALERANLPLRAGEALFFYLVGVVIVTVGAFFLFGSLVGGLVVGALVAIGPPAIVAGIAAQRRRQFMMQLPDTLQLLAGTLRAGYSLMQGVEAVSQEVSEPMGKELRRVVTESRLGRPLEESLDGIAERMASPDFAWAVMAIRIQREVGGNLSELLLTVADTMTARERLRRDISALTAEGRISAIVLGILPVGLGLVMFAINPDYISRLFETTLGNILLALAVVGMLVGFAWMRKIIQIEI